MELNSSQSLFETPIPGYQLEQSDRSDPDLPELSAQNQHLVSQRIACVFLSQFNDSVSTYMLAKNEGRYKKGRDMFGDVSVMDDAKNALFENIIWAFELSSFDRIPFATCCQQADDDHFGDPENIRTLLFKCLKDEITEMVSFVRISKGKSVADRIAKKLAHHGFEVFASPEKTMVAA